VHFCATCDGPFYRGREVLVVGGGNSAGEESLFLTKFASKVTIATHAPMLSASRVVVEKVEASPQIEVLSNVSPAAFRGEGHLEAVDLKDVQGGEMRTLHPAGVFVFIGLSPNTALVQELVETDERGFIVSSPTLETSAPGIFVAGDCRAGSTKQAASAAGEGAAVALAIRAYIQPRAGGTPRPELAAAMAPAGAS
ncbi:MAG TPA: FAD-dependent oxidoreductase, partial [Dehalococcoidia bacterium]|nr:FAD-dependent oxidoreductase [Dehalococcoidia bacterium]